MLYPPADYYSVTLANDDGDEFDLGYESEDALSLEQAREVARRHVGAQVWAHGRLPGARESTRWRVRGA